MRRDLCMWKETCENEVAMDMSKDTRRTKRCQLWGTPLICQQKPRSRSLLKRDLLHMKRDLRRDLCMWKETCENVVAMDMSKDTWCIRGCTYSEVHYWYANRDLVYEMGPVKMRPLLTCQGKSIWKETCVYEKRHTLYEKRRVFMERDLLYMRRDLSLYQRRPEKTKSLLTFQ